MDSPGKVDLVRSRKLREGEREERRKERKEGGKREREQYQTVDSSPSSFRNHFLYSSSLPFCLSAETAQDAVESEAEFTHLCALLDDAFMA